MGIAATPSYPASTVDAHHASGDQGLKVIRQTDLSKNAVRVGAGPGSRFANVAGVRDSLGAGPQVVTRPMSSCSRGAQLVLDHPRILHELGEIEDTTVRTEASRNATRHPVVHGLRAEVLFQRTLQLCTVQ